MKSTLRIYLGAALAAAVLSASLMGSASAANSTPAISAFQALIANVHSYTFRLQSHEVKGSQTQSRVYQYWFMKPHFAKTLILSGDGQGSGGVWSGGNTVSGHQGGILSMIHLTVSIHDPRATSLLGYTIPDGLLQNVVDKYVTTPGRLSQVAGGKINGQLTDAVTLIPNGPTPKRHITKMMIFFSRTSHLPLRNIEWSGNTIILDQSFLHIKLHAHLNGGNF
ncbi:MAG: hypothetical protein ACYDA5_08615 [Vulcanimicrobiaceae bacterium]